MNGGFLDVFAEASSTQEKELILVAFMEELEILAWEHLRHAVPAVSLPSAMAVDASYGGDRLDFIYWVEETDKNCLQIMDTDPYLDWLVHERE